MKSFSFQWRFIVLIALFEAAYLYFSATPLWPVVIHGFTVRPASLLIDVVFPAFNVHADGTRIVSDRASLNVLAGCEGTEVLVLLLSAILASRASALAIATGVVAGLAFVFVVNLARILALFAVLSQMREHFSLAHGYLAPVLIVLLTLLFFLAWSKWSAVET